MVSNPINIETLLEISIMINIFYINLHGTIANAI